ncbi:hypothetical protein J2T58_000069 [Methanocalculus alkaliphilus]|uniref:VWA domain-containing protein n=1 Tax=Methanocalculus alkaliphilus TaxID=768730 RepID=UPI00209F7199|nr:VWA domain-containing protein [Methanocalculus alkaliphilus]MCP1714242.1 hypothetical protein [Methanocalculus alkaliphilus]
MGIRLVVLTLLLIIAAPALASATPDAVTVQSDTEWLIAGSTAYATITATVSNNSAPLPAIPVTFSLDDPAMGTLSAASTSTNGEGKATVRFTPATISGDAVIRISAGYDPVEEVFIQKIDHGAPKAIANLTYPSKATVGSTVLLSLTLRDEYGNPVDDRRTSEFVTLTTSSAGEGSAFPATGNRTITLPVGPEGSVSTELSLDTYPGEHIISIDTPGISENKIFSIFAITNGIPHDVSYIVSPVTGTAPADGETTFTIRYYFSDQYGNPAGAQKINFHVTGPTGVLEEPSKTTSSLGEILLTYGPLSTIGTFEITCSPVENPSFNNTITLAFHNSEPVEMLLTANPQMIASRDANPDSRADIRVKVIDKRGHPVAGEEVTFTILPGATEGFSQDPELSIINAVTNEYGFAIAHLYPGDFTQDWTDESFNHRAIGTATIHAQWKDQEEEITITWKNYPFLSISTLIEPETVRVNETINVTIQISGDGWFLQSGSRVDVIQVIDTSGSMSAGDIEPDRISAAQSVTKEFTDLILGIAGNRLGIFSSANTITLEEALTSDTFLIHQAIDGVSSGGSGRLMRAGCYQAIQHLEYNSRPGVVKAVILLGDMNSWNPTGNHLGDEYKFDNLLTYALEQDVRIYTVMLAAQETSNTYQASADFSEATGGRAFNARNYQDLMEAYLQIAEELSHEAGVNTTMHLSHENVKVNQAEHPGGDVFEYIPKTVITNRYHNGTVTMTEIDQTNDWNGVPSPAQNLFFDIGTIHLGQTWEARYQLRVLEEGTIDIFDPSSVVTFEDAPEDGQLLQTTYINALPSIGEIQLKDYLITIDNLRSETVGHISDKLEVAWDLEYEGSEEVTQKIRYAVVDPMMYDAFTRGFTIPEDRWQPEKELDGSDRKNFLFVAGLNGICLIRIDASAPGSPNDRAEIAVPIGAASWQDYIKIE